MNLPVVQDRELLGTVSTYLQLLENFRQRGYSCATFVEFQPEHRRIILRHDVDIGLHSAVAMAECEAGSGYTSTYFILVTSEFYNVLSKVGRDSLRKISSLGHALGLHFDPSLYQSTNLESDISQECDLLEQIVSRPIEVIAPHRPRAVCPQWLGWDGFPAGRLHAYHPRFFNEAGYVSDSAGRWAFGHPLDHEKVAQNRGIQLLTHPHLWMGEEPATRDDRIREELDMRAADLNMHAEANFTGFLAVGH